MLKEIRMFLPDVMVSRIEVNRAKFNLQHGSAVSRNGMIRILLKEAMGIREQSPDSENLLDEVKKKFDTMWKSLTPDEVSMFVPGKRHAREDVVSFVSSMGGVAHRQELLEHFRLQGIKDGTLDQRLRNAVNDCRLFKFKMAVYSLRDISGSNPELLPYEAEAIERIKLTYSVI